MANEDKEKTSLKAFFLRYLKYIQFGNYFLQDGANLRHTIGKPVLLYLGIHVVYFTLVLQIASVGGAFSTVSHGLINFFMLLEVFPVVPFFLAQIAYLWLHGVKKVNTESPYEHSILMTRVRLLKRYKVDSWFGRLNISANSDRAKEAKLDCIELGVIIGIVCYVLCFVLLFKVTLFKKLVGVAACVVVEYFIFLMAFFFESCASPLYYYENDQVKYMPRYSDAEMAQGVGLYTDENLDIIYNNINEKYKKLNPEKPQRTSYQTAYRSTGSQQTSRQYTGSQQTSQQRTGSQQTNRQYTGSQQTSRQHAQQKHYGSQEEYINARGEQGEKIVRARIKHWKDDVKENYPNIIVKDIEADCRSIFDENKKCVLLRHKEMNSHAQEEFDHLLVTSMGVINIETKNYGGTVTVTKNGNVWTNAADKIMDKSPKYQMKDHTNLLKKILSNTGVPVYPMVCFADSNMKLKDDENYCETAPYTFFYIYEFDDVLNQIVQTHIDNQSLLSASKINEVIRLINAKKVNRIK